MGAQPRQYFQVYHNGQSMECSLCFSNVIKGAKIRSDFFPQRVNRGIRPRGNHLSRRYPTQLFPTRAKLRWGEDGKRPSSRRSFKIPSFREAKNMPAVGQMRQQLRGRTSMQKLGGGGGGLPPRPEEVSGAPRVRSEAQQQQSPALP